MSEAIRRSVGFAPILVFLLLGMATVRGDAAAPATAPAVASSVPKVGDTAADFTLDGLDGKSASLSDFTSRGPVVLIMLRGWPGYQCPLCTRQVADFAAHAKELTDAGATVVLVYPGPAEDLKAHAEDFFKDKSLSDTFHILIDPDFKMTNAYALRWNAPHETAYPSTFVIDAKRVVRYALVSKEHGGRSKAKDVIKQLAKLK
jgi:peroxiredoxin